MRAISLGLALLALTSGGAAAACRCACLDGEMRSVCNGPLDPPALCDRLCPLSVRPPSIRAPGAPPEIPGDVLSDDADPSLPTGGAPTQQP
ncbi:hypothetical protein ACFQ12_02295, partial [Methylobacterium trifolii]